MKIKFDSNHEDHIADVGNMIAVVKVAAPKMQLNEKNAGGLLGDTKNNEKTDKP